MSEGLLIAFEGLDGAGTTTQAERTRDRLAETRGERAYLTREPTDGPVGAQIRLGLAGRVDFDPKTMALLFAADRLDHLAQDVVPKLDDGVTVLVDRYVLSSIAYQMAEPGVDGEWVAAINREARDPDLTVFLDVPPEECLSRMEASRWRAELYETEERLERVYQNYTAAIEDLREHGQDVRVVDGTRPIPDVTEAVVSIVGDRLDAAAE